MPLLTVTVVVCWSGSLRRPTTEGWKIFVLLITVPECLLSGPHTWVHHEVDLSHHVEYSYRFPRQLLSTNISKVTMPRIGYWLEGGLNNYQKHVENQLPRYKSAIKNIFSKNKESEDNTLCHPQKYLFINNLIVGCKIWIKLLSSCYKNVLQRNIPTFGTYFIVNSYI